MLVIKYKKTGDLFLHIEGATFESITTGNISEISKEDSSKFSIPVNLNEMLQKNDTLLLLIKELTLKMNT